MDGRFDVYMRASEYSPSGEHFVFCFLVVTTTIFCFVLITAAFFFFPSSISLAADVYREGMGWRDGWWYTRDGEEERQESALSLPTSNLLLPEFTASPPFKSPPPNLKTT